MTTRNQAIAALGIAKAIQHDVDRILRPKRGFAAMSPEKKREIASKGGKAAHALGTAHKWTCEEAQAAGRIGGRISKKHGPNRRKVA